MTKYAEHLLHKRFKCSLRAYVGNAVVVWYLQVTQPPPSTTNLLHNKLYYINWYFRKPWLQLS